MGRERSGKTERNGAYSINFPRQTTVAREINGERQQNGRSGFLQMSRWRGEQGLQGHILQLKVKNEQQKICEIVAEFVAGARNSYGGVFLQHRPQAEDEGWAMWVKNHILVAIHDIYPGIFYKVGSKSHM